MIRVVAVRTPLKHWPVHSMYGLVRSVPVRTFRAAVYKSVLRKGVVAFLQEPPDYFRPMSRERKRQLIEYYRAVP